MVEVLREVEYGQRWYSPDHLWGWGIYSDQETQETGEICDELNERALPTPTVRARALVTGRIVISLVLFVFYYDIQRQKKNTDMSVPLASF